MTEKQGKYAIGVLCVIASLLADGWHAVAFAFIAIVWMWLP